MYVRVCAQLTTLFRHNFAINPSNLCGTAAADSPLFVSLTQEDHICSTITMLAMFTVLLPNDCCNTIVDVCIRLKSLQKAFGGQLK